MSKRSPEVNHTGMTPDPKDRKKEDTGMDDEGNAIARALQEAAEQSGAGATAVEASKCESVRDEHA